MSFSIKNDLRLAGSSLPNRLRGDNTTRGNSDAMPSNRKLNLLANTLALLGGAGIFALILMYPWTVALSGPVVRESLFVLMVLGGALGFAYGLGFRAETGIFGFILSPVTVFVVMAAALLWIAYALVTGPQQLP
ncbi:MAG: hypothetical protein P8014_03700 [Acidihalobacter sp.]|uniref:hypothetical protein n=1 Tax=Acidihalobacter sp. TaxID=1872108 RepID=UPI00307CF34A